MCAGETTQPLDEELSMSNRPLDPDIDEPDPDFDDDDQDDWDDVSYPDDFKPMNQGY